MKTKYLTLLLIFITFFLASCAKEDDIDKKTKLSNKQSRQIDLLSLKKEYAQIDTVEYLEKYIQKVIKNGSFGHNYPGGEMQAGLVDEKTAKKISYFVAELSGRKSTHHKEVKKAQMYYTSNCGGCHGDDGKGLNKRYPDLTEKNYFGIEERKRELEKLLKKERH